VAVPGLCVCCLLPLILCAAASAQKAGEYQVKAAYLYNFAKFVEWPPERFKTPASPLRICVLGENPFGDDLDRLALGKSISGHALSTAYLRANQDFQSCEILFIARSEQRRVAHIVHELRQASVLTVGDVNGFAARAGIINFTLQHERVRFEINLWAAEQAHLRVNAQLLTVAQTVLYEATSD
jgi:hypothetical protein